jgi:Leucine-rich repeat (LRR) protein
MVRTNLDTRDKLQKYIDDFFTTNHTHTMVHLGDMGITSLEGITFPEFMTYLPVSHNQITSLEGVVFPSNLRVLQVPMNKITSLEGVDFLHKLTNLNDLQLQQNQITSLEGIVFPPGLVSLDLSDNKITSFKGMQFPLSLLNLKLQGNRIDVRTVSELKNPSPFVIREIVAAFPETGPYFQRKEEEKGEIVDRLFEMVHDLYKQKGGRKNKTARRKRT